MRCTRATASSARTPNFAAAVRACGITFVGPETEHLALFGDKTRARALAEASVPVIRGLSTAVTLEQAQAFFSDIGGGANGQRW